MNRGTAEHKRIMKIILIDIMLDEKRLSVKNPVKLADQVFFFSRKGHARIVHVGSNDNTVPVIYKDVLGMTEQSQFLQFI